MFADGYPAHMHLEIYMWCRDNEIIYVILFPNSTHIMQPCDLTLFKSLKSRYQTELTKYQLDEMKTSIDEVEFVTILANTIRDGLKPDIAKNGFQAAGLFPINRRNIHEERLIGNNARVPTTSALSCPTSSTQVSNSALSLPAPSSTPESISDFEHLNEKSQIISEMKFLNDKLKSILAPDDSETRLNADIFSQLLNKMQNSVPSQPAPTLPLNPILPPPPPNIRVGRKRQAKVDSCGVMITDEIIQHTQNKKAQKEAADEIKEQNKKRRLEKKKEKAATVISTGKKRGRPAKNAP